MASLDHPLKAAVEALRATVRAASPKIQAEVKWNSPSFYTSDHSATLAGRPRRGRARAKAPYLQAIIRQWIRQLRWVVRLPTIVSALLANYDSSFPFQDPP